MASQVAGHDDDGVLEVDSPALGVGKPAIVQHLQQDVEHIGMCLLYLIEEHHLIGFSAHRFGQLSALIVSHISWRRSYET